MRDFGEERMIWPHRRQRLPFRMDLGVPWEHPVLDKGEKESLIPSGLLTALGFLRLWKEGVGR